MHLSWFRTLALVIPHVIIVLSSPAPRSYDTHHYYVLEHTSRAGVDSRTSVVEAAQALGVEVVEQVGELQGHWLVRAEMSIAAREPGSDSVLAKYASLQDRADSQSRSRSDDSEEARDIVSAIKSLSLQVPRQRTKRAPPALRQEADTPSKIVAQRLGIQDPLFSDQWHLVNDEFPEHSMNATGVWDMGLTGKGVISSLIDDGLDYTSEDLADNFVRSFLAHYCHILTTVIRMPTIRMTTMTTRTFLHPNSSMTPTVHAAQAKSPQSKTPLAASGLPTTRKSPASESSPGVYPTPTRLQRSTMDTKTCRFTAAAGVRRMTGGPWLAPRIS